MNRLSRLIEINTWDENMKMLQYLEIILILKFKQTSYEKLRMK